MPGKAHVGTSTCTAVDAAGNSTSASFTVTVQTLTEATTVLLAQVRAASLPAGVQDDLEASLIAAAQEILAAAAP